MKPQKSVQLPSKKRLSDDDVQDFADKAETVTQKSKTKTSKKKVAKPAAEKVIRDSFTMPEHDHVLIQKTISRLMRSGILMNKGEVLRAGLHALKGMTAAELKEISASVEKVKTGRPTE